MVQSPLEMVWITFEGQMRADLSRIPMSFSGQDALEQTKIRADLDEIFRVNSLLTHRHMIQKIAQIDENGS